MEQEYQQLQQDLQNSVNQMMDKISKKSLRPLQKQSYLSMASCLDNNQYTDQQINQCIQNAGRKSQIIQNMIQNEMNLFQTKIQRCSQVCQDDANHLVTDDNKTDSNEIAKIEKVLFQCSKACVDKHVAMLPNLEAKILSEIARQG